MKWEKSNKGIHIDDRKKVGEDCNKKKNQGEQR